MENEVTRYAVLMLEGPWSGSYVLGISDAKSFYSTPQIARALLFPTPHDAIDAIHARNRNFNGSPSDRFALVPVRSGVVALI